MPKGRKKAGESPTDRVITGASTPDDSQQAFPPIRLPIAPPYPPQEAKNLREIPRSKNSNHPEWLYEPKWDGFRCLAFRKGGKVLLQSKAGQPLGRYFPELVEALAESPFQQFVLDGEIVIFVNDRLSFDDLLMRIHPAASRVRKLAAETPCTFQCFDLLVDAHGKKLTQLPHEERRIRLEEFFNTLRQGSHAAQGKSNQHPAEMVRLSPASRNYLQAQKWMTELAAMGLDGVIAKRLDEPYRSGERTAMVKIKRIRTADCVVGGFRYAEKGGVGSLLLGLYNEEGRLDHVGFTSSFHARQRQELLSLLKPLIAGPGFTGRAPGGPSRWSTRRTDEWQPLRPKLVCEVQYDHFSGGRFRHGTKFLRWRPEKKPQQCTFEQLSITVKNSKKSRNAA